MMDNLAIFFLITTLIGGGVAGFCLYLLKKMDIQRIRMENYLVDISIVMSDYWEKIDALFSQSIHYYDETIYQFVESTKDVKNAIDKTLDEYDDLREFIVPIKTEKEKQDEQEKELIGVVKSYPITRALEVPTK
jgi:type I site-specific restriction endonuclease